MGLSKFLDWIRRKFLNVFLGKHITIFVIEKGSDCYEVELADSKSRKKLLVWNIRKVSPKRYRLLDRQPF